MAELALGLRAAESNVVVVGLEFHVSTQGEAHYVDRLVGGDDADRKRV